MEIVDSIVLILLLFYVFHLSSFFLSFSFSLLMSIGGFSPKETIYDGVSTSAKLPSPVSSRNDFTEKPLKSKISHSPFHSSL